jgi:SAM-dependent methyltransferase
MTTVTDRDYILGTHDDELERLALQHRVWRSRALDGWRRAGFTTGQTIIDVGCGPGFATRDLAGIVGATGRIIAVDRSARYLAALNADRLGNVETYERDLDVEPLPEVLADGAWGRWIFAFLKQPRPLLENIRLRLKPGARVVFHEYLHYSTWRLTPRSSDFDAFVETVMRSWRDDGGEPDIGLDLPVWLGELGFDDITVKPVLEVIRAADYMWEWPRAFVRTGTQRLVDLGYLTQDAAAGVARALIEAERNPNAWLVTPAVIEVVARAPGTTGS